MSTVPGRVWSRWVEGGLAVEVCNGLLLQVVLGLHIVRGDNICVVGEIDEDIDSRLELHNMKADPINSVPHGI